MPAKVRFPGSLKTRITLFTLVIFITSLWSLTFYASQMLRQDMQQQLSGQQFAAVSSIARAADIHLNERIRVLERLAGALGPEAMAQPQLLQRTLQEQPALQILFNAGLLITDTSGTAIAEAPRTVGRTGVNFMDRSAIAGALRDGHTTIGSPTVDKRLATPVVGIATPLRDTTGRITGALAGVIGLREAEFLDYLTQSPYGETGRYFLLARPDRLVITATQKDRVMQPLRPRGVAEEVDRFADGYEGALIYRNREEVEVLGAAKGLALAPWSVTSSISTAEAFAPIHAMQQRMVMAALLLSVLVGVLTWWMLRRQLWPLLDTARTLARMASSEVPAQPLPVARQDEIGTLITGFNHLLDSLDTQKLALEKQLQLFSAFADALPTPVFIKNAYSIFTACNRAYEEAFGIQRQNMIGKTVLELEHLPAPMREVFQAADLELLRTGGQTSEEIDITYADGSVRTALYQRRTFDLGGGQGSALLGLIVDISERKRMEQALKNSEESYRLLAENANDVIWTMDTQGRFTYVSPSVQKLRGYTSAEAMQQTLQQTLVPAALPLATEAMQKNCAALRAGMPTSQFRAELEQTCKDGSTVWTEVTANAVFNAQGRCVGMLGITRDISERKQRDDYRHFYSRILEMLAAGYGQTPILQAIILGIEALRPGMLCSILLLDEEGRHLHGGIAPSLPAAYNAAIEGLEIGMGVGSCGTAAFTGQRVVVEDIATHPYWANFKELATQSGLGACWSQPICSSTQRVLGTFGIYHRSAQQPSEADIILIEQTARLASITIEKTRAEEKIRNLAYYDSLTHLPNRRMLDERLHQALASSQRTGQYGALMLLDLDNFKPLNDTHGHGVGDLLLIEVAARLLTHIREVDTAARLGGDEFVVLLGGLDTHAAQAQAQALAVAEKIRLALAETYRLSAPQPEAPTRTIEHHCAASIGVTLLAGWDSANAQEILKRADDAMYQAKDAGRNTIYFSPHEGEPLAGTH